MARFLFLQGNATPFWSSLGRQLALRGHNVFGIYFNCGDQFFCRFPKATSYRGDLAGWPGWLSRFVHAHTPDVIVLFGRYRPHHLPAVMLAHQRGITVWNFDEGYWRPGYVTFEKLGLPNEGLVSCPSALLMERAASHPEPPIAHHPAGRFGERAVFDIVYHLLRVSCQPLFPFYRPHHAVDPFVEYMAYVPSLLLGPSRRRRGRTILCRMEAVPSFLYPMQLEGDFQIRMRSRFSGNLDALALVLDSFARSAPREALLAVKAHPLDPGTRDWACEIDKLANRVNLTGRVSFFHTDALDRAVRACIGIVTINSTVGTLGLALGKPVLVLGEARYAMPGLTYQGDIDGFWTRPPVPDPALVCSLRRLLATEFLVPGDFFSPAGRQAAVGAAITRMEAEIK